MICLIKCSMKKIFSILIFTLCLLYCIVRPRQIALATAGGLALWYHSVLPTLLPFSILSGIMVRSGIYDSLSERIYPWFSKIYPVRAPLIYPLIAGFLFGFPLGSKICADLYDTGKITAKEAEVISCISNNFGPAFLYNYMVLSLNGGFLSGWMLLLICYLPPLLLGRFVLFSVQHQLPEKRPQKMPASRSAISLKIIDDGIMNGFSTMIKLAGYIMLFAIAADFLKQFPIKYDLILCLCTGLLEITNGIHLTSGAALPFHVKYLIDIFIVSFGGISGLFQTASMLRQLSFSLRHYACFKLACAILATGFLELVCRLYAI